MKRRRSLPRHGHGPAELDADAAYSNEDKSELHSERLKHAELHEVDSVAYYFEMAANEAQAHELAAESLAVEVAAAVKSSS
jgi:hypothetical protein